MAISDKEKERLSLAKEIVLKMRRCTEINQMLDHYNTHGTLSVNKRQAEVIISDLSFQELTFIIKNYPTYKARKLKKADSENDPEKKKELLQDYSILCKQLEEARIAIKNL